MNTSVEGIIVNNCQYAPIYLIQDAGATQANTYVLTSSNIETPKPVSNNLKTFYENSGNIENGIINADTGVRANLIKKKESILIGNNLKLASFLLPKNENINLNKQYVVDNIVLKPSTITATNNHVPVNHYPVNTVPKLDIDRKIVKLKEVPIIKRPEKVLPKIKPKDNTSSPTQSKYTSVQLIKLGETYHSLNQLSDEQIKMVNQALKMFNDPDKTAPEPTYDPVTNTKYIYKIISPKDLTVVAKKKITLKDKKNHNHTKISKKIEEKIVMPLIPKEIPIKKTEEKIVKPVISKEVPIKKIEEKIVKPLIPKEVPIKKIEEKIVKPVIPKEVPIKKIEEKIVKPVIPKEVPIKKIEERIVKPVIPKEVSILKEDIEEEEEVVPPAEPKVTRSGRKVKLPKQILPEGSLQKTKKKSGTIVTCFQCSAEFGSLYRLQKHYQNHPTHIPAKIHSNLFHCLLAIIKSGSEGNKTNIFIQQLEQLIVKLKSLLPCLLKKVDGREGQSCTINEDIGRLFGMNPGKYNIDVEALNCVKDKNGYCIHNPPKINKDQNKPIQLAHEVPNLENETDNCARINSVAKWPTVSKRIWKLKHKTHELGAKKMRLKSEGDTLIDLGTEDFIFRKEENCVNSSNITPENNLNAVAISPENTVKNTSHTQDCNIECTLESDTQTENIEMGEHSKPKQNYVQFHSTHFDIRSSPIKPSSTVFRKFQINPSKMSNYDVQVIRSLQMVKKPKDKRVPKPNPDKNLHISIPNGDNSLHLKNKENGLHITLPSSNNSLCVSLPYSDIAQHVMIPNSSNGLHVSLKNSNNTLQASIPNVDNRLHGNTSNFNTELRVSKPNSNNNGLHVSMPNSHDTLNASMANSDNRLHASMPDIDNSLHVPMPNSDQRLHVNLPSSDELDLELPNSNDSLEMPNLNDSVNVTITNTDCLHDLFKDDVGLSSKESDGIDPDLKDWIISTSEKSVDSFTKSNSLLEAALLNVIDSGDKSSETHKNNNPNDDMPSLGASDSRLLTSQGESVLNFLDTLSNDLYPETEIRNNGVDFQMDLFTFHNS